MNLHLTRFRGWHRRGETGARATRRQHSSHGMNIKNLAIFALVMAILIAIGLLGNLEP